MKLSHEQLHQRLLKQATFSPERATAFFKTKPGDYAHHDQFMGVSVPVLRKFVPTLDDWEMADLSILLKSGVNEERLLALFLLVRRYRRTTPDQRGEIIKFYQAHLDHVNNWNLVDASAHQLLGDYLVHSPKNQVLLDLAASPSLWRRRVAMVASFAFIQRGEVTWTLRLAKQFFQDPHDLIHKATGWMLREVGKQDLKALLDFLDVNAPSMPRVMLRYAIERLPNPQRLGFLKKNDI